MYYKKEAKTRKIYTFVEKKLAKNLTNPEDSHICIAS
jgi:hypothetical protein